MVKRTGAQNAVDIRKTKLPAQRQRSNAAEMIRNIISKLPVPTLETPSSPSAESKDETAPRTPLQCSPQKTVAHLEDSK